MLELEKGARTTRSGRAVIGALVVTLWIALWIAGALARASADEERDSVSVTGASAPSDGTPQLDRAPRVLTERQARALGVGTFVRDAGGMGLDGELHSWRDGAGERGTVVVMTSLSCPLCQKFAPAIARAEKTWTEQGFGFVHVGVGGLDSVADLRAHAAALGLDGLVLSDAREQLADAFDVQRTTEVFVIDARGTLRYRGALSDQYGLGYALDEPRVDYLAAACEALLAGSDPAVHATRAPGCIVERSNTSQGPVARGETITYARHVSRLVQNNCLECHRDGGVAPFALDDYEQVARRASMLQAVVDLGTMPPWFAAGDEDGHAGTWRNDRSLLPDEEHLLAKWIADGKPKGDASELPLPPTFDDTGWQGGEPDAVFTMPEPFDVPAEGRVRYQYIAVPTGLERARWVDGIEVRPGAAEVVHHVLVWALPPEAFEGNRFRRWDLLDERRGFFTAWAPGVDAVRYPDGHAKHLPEGAVLLLELHYTPNGSATTDRTSVGVHFADDGPDWEPESVVRIAGISNRGIEIPAGANAHVETSAGVVARTMRVEALMPHMHLRGASFRFELEPADGESRTLLEVPEYDFNWQVRYELTEPLVLEPRDVIRVEAVYDNSELNPANPDPERAVGWGQQTDDEMLIGFVEYVLVEEDLDHAPLDPLLLSFDPGTLTQLRLLAAASGGSVPRDRLRREFHATFDLLDANGDGRVDADELPLLAAD